MSWNEYREKLGITHDFGKFGCGDFWVKLRRIDSFSYGESKKSSSAGGELTVDEIRADPKLIEQQRSKVEEELVGCILAWHITDPTIQDDPDASDEEKAMSLPLPTKDNVTSLDKLPSEFLGAMFIWLRDDSDLAKRVPKGTGTPSGRR